MRAFDNSPKNVSNVDQTVVTMVLLECIEFVIPRVEKDIPVLGRQENGHLLSVFKVQLMDPFCLLINLASKED